MEKVQNWQIVESDAIQRIPDWMLRELKQRGLDPQSPVGARVLVDLMDLYADEIRVSDPE